MSKKIIEAPPRILKLSAVLAYFAIGSLLFLYIGVHGMENYLDGMLFAICTVLAGVAFGSLVYAVIYHFTGDIIISKQAKGLTFFSPLAFGFALIFFGGGVLVNEYWPGEMHCKGYVIKDIDKKGTFVFIDNGTREERLMIGTDFNKAHNIGDTVELCITTGCLGFKYYEVKWSGAGMKHWPQKVTN